MKPKKTLSTWLTSRYQLIIRSDENFAEKTSMGFTYSKVILFSLIVFSAIFLVSLLLSKTLLARWFDPRHAQMEMNRQLLELKDKLDSLEIESKQKDQFIMNFQRVLSGDTSNFKDPAEVMATETKPLPKANQMNLTPADSQFRKEFEKSAITNMGFLERNKALSDLSAEEGSVFWASLLISMLIILIEIGPVLSKLIMPLGPYDIALAKEELLHMANEEGEIRKDKVERFEKRKVYRERQKEMNDQLAEKIVQLQQKNIDRELDKWERGEWKPEDHRASMDEVMRKIKSQYQFKEDDLL